MFDEGAAEIVTYDALSNRLYFTNADANSVGIINFDDPNVLALESEIDLDAYGEGDPDPTAAQLAAVGDLGCEDVLFIDGKYSKDSIFYLVTSNEVSGTVSVFKINGAIVPAGISEVNGQSEIAIYPNPAHDFVNIDKKGNYRVIDMTGRTVISETITNRIDISALNSGIYFVESDKGDIVRFVKS